MERQGELLGFIPYDFRWPGWLRIKESMWNPDEERIVVPKAFGVGWTLNLYRLRERRPSAFYCLIGFTALWVTWKISRRRRCNC